MTGSASLLVHNIVSLRLVGQPGQALTFRCQLGDFRRIATPDRLAETLMCLETQSADSHRSILAKAADLPNDPDKK